MKSKIFSIITFCSMVALFSCNSGTTTDSSSNSTSNNETSTNASGQSGVQDDVSAKNIVQVASGSKDHTTLVTAVKAGELVDALSNAGPFTVFAPTNAAFDKLPAGTVEGLLKPEKKETLQDILQYHVFVGVLKAESFTDGQILGQVNGGNIKISIKDGKVMINDKATIVASITTSNGIIHVIDEVLLPPSN
ncbi:MAG: fasciclin domain-containing protein [Bacteroidetes bacterium]|nr:fasciclin domain-containing protein [Bacteroidota bacterium]